MQRPSARASSRPSSRQVAAVARASRAPPVETWRASHERPTPTSQCARRCRSPSQGHRRDVDERAYVSYCDTKPDLTTPHAPRQCASAAVRSCASRSCQRGALRVDCWTASRAVSPSPDLSEPQKRSFPRTPTDLHVLVRSGAGSGRRAHASSAHRQVRRAARSCRSVPDGWWLRTLDHWQPAALEAPPARPDRGEPAPAVPAPLPAPHRSTPVG